MNNVEGLIQILTIVAIVLVMAICALAVVVLVVKMKNNKSKKTIEEEVEKTTSSSNSYNIQSILNFMDFEKIEDNMIIQKKGKYLMALECQGVNYDLMSELERASVEQGFINFLNTLRSEIQIYVQTRTVNLEDSISSYKQKFKEIENKYLEMEDRYEQMKSSEDFTEKEVQKAYMELMKQKNKYEYTQDIIADTERNSLNSKVLHKKYYIIIPAYEDEIVTDNYSKDEIQNMIFSELYTKARSLVRTLSKCEVSAKIMNSEELIELLYIAYNRDESDIFSARKALSAGFEDLYSTAPDVLDKKIKLIDKQIEQEAIREANEAVSEARSDKEMMLRLREENRQNMIFDLAEDLLNENSQYIGQDIAEDAKAKVRRKKRETKEGGNDDVEQTKQRRGRKPARQ